MKKHLIVSLTVGACLLLPSVGTAFATPHGPINPITMLPTPSSTPTTGHKAGPTNTCQSVGAGPPPGHAASANGSPFNSSGTAGNVYAGNPGTKSLANSNSSSPVAQYDNACLN
jgi:hypothetical protein